MIKEYYPFLITFIAGVVAVYLFKSVVLFYLKKIAQRTVNKLDDFVIALIDRLVVPLLYLGALYFSLQKLVLPENIVKLVDSLVIVILTIQLIRFLIAILIYAIQKLWLKTDPYAEGTPKSYTIFSIIRVVVWGLGIVFIMDNLGFNISAVIAGLGVGGVAIALASQNIIKDLFNYFVIFFDKPFEIGDFVIIGDFLGTIEHIGLKTTRVRSLGGEQLIFGNSDLTSSRLRNYKRMEKRRVVFKLGITYQTPAEKLKKIPGIIKEIIESVALTKFDRAHFQSYGDFNLVIEIVYYTMSSDYNKYMDIQQDINLKIKEAFEKEGIEFAYPTQTLFVNKEKA